MKIKKNNNHVTQMNTLQGKEILLWKKQLHSNNIKIARKS
jgi:hypothetical protein